LTILEKPQTFNQSAKRSSILLMRPTDHAVYSWTMGFGCRSAKSPFPPGTNDPNEMECDMKTFLKKTFARLMKDEKGVTLVEYAIALTLAVAVGTGALLTLGDDVDAQMGEASLILQ
jgi:pilus assembly protein Flp/PilA